MKSPHDFLIPTDEVERTILFDAYLEGKLDPSVKEPFEQVLETDAELKAELMIHYSLRRLIADDARTNLVKRIHQNAATSDSTEQPVRIVPFRRRYASFLWAAAASVALLIAFGLWWTMRSPVVSNETIIPPLVAQQTVWVPFKEGELGAVPMQGKDSWALTELIVVVQTDKKAPPQYNLLSNDTLRLTLPMSVMPSLIAQESAFDNFLDVTIEGKKYRLLKNQKGELK